MKHQTLIIGSGMAGLACARTLAEAGQASVILDKGRGIGGRMATRRMALEGGALQFDHGAQYLSATSSTFSAFLSELPAAVGLWPDEGARPHYVGLPGMSGLPRAMADGLEIRQGAEVSALLQKDGAWAVTTGSELIHAMRIVLTVPAPQVPALIGADHPLAVPLGRVQMAPCLTLMAAFPGGSPRPFISRRPDTGPLGWIAQDSSKPGRTSAHTTWVAQASAGWSATHLEQTPAEIAAQMLPLLCAAIDADPAEALSATAHRWRYAQASTALGQPFLRSADASLYLGGDWCLGPRAEDAWVSGHAIAQDILEPGHAG